MSVVVPFCLLSTSCNNNDLYLHVLSIDIKSIIILSGARILFNFAKEKSFDIFAIFITLSFKAQSRTYILNVLLIDS